MHSLQSVAWRLPDSPSGISDREQAVVNSRGNLGGERPRVYASLLQQGSSSFHGLSEWNMFTPVSFCHLLSLSNNVPSVMVNTEAAGGNGAIAGHGRVYTC